MAPTESWLEDRLVEFMREHRLPELERQYPLELGPGWRIRFDFADPSGKAALEADGRLWHSSPSEVARDCRRDEACAARGWAVERITWLELVEQPGEVIDRIRRLLDVKRAA
ncbi:MAG TPA: DUF559 domain-containing protein [Acidimicrobiia bacterium]|nr:DUF559 domain-containing protein [Acidimicrobiia bacterium]